MTTAAQISPQGSLAAPWDARRARATSDWIVWSIAVGVLLVAYLLLQNPYWVPGGDSEVYVTTARNIATGRGNTFNGLPATLVPPGWPWVMAQVMKVWPTFAVLKSLTMSCMLGALAIDFWICRRYASARLSAAVIVLAGLISHVYTLTFWLHSDALFCLLSSAALLLAFQISEGRRSDWRIVATMLLCSAAVWVRWAGLLSWLLVGAVLLEGELRPRKNRRWIQAAATGVIALATFVSIRAMLTVSPELQKEIKEIGMEDSGAPQGERPDANIATTYSLFSPARGGIIGWIARAVSWGNWTGYLFWQPLRLGPSNALIGLFGLLVGTMALAPTLLVAWPEAWQKRWFWPALALYSFALAINWPAPNARYLVPIAPFLLLGVFKGMHMIGRRWPHPVVGRTCNVLLAYFVVALVVCNGALWACDAYVARSDDFYGNYEAGMEQDLISTGKFLGEPDRDHDVVAVSERYVNLGRVRVSRMGLRVTSFLTGKSVYVIPSKYLRGGDPRKNPYFLNWARELGVRYAIYQPEVSPWRLFHFRVSWLQELMSDEPAVDTGAGWRLYWIPIDGDEAERIRLTPTKNWPTRVPGM